MSHTATTIVVSLGRPPQVQAGDDPTDAAIHLAFVTSTSEGLSRRIFPSTRTTSLVFVRAAVWRARCAERRRAVREPLNAGSAASDNFLVFTGSPSNQATGACGPNCRKATTHPRSGDRRGRSFSAPSRSACESSGGREVQDSLQHQPPSLHSCHFRGERGSPLLYTGAGCRTPGRA
jgi:hypothetical protein